MESSEPTVEELLNHINNLYGAFHTLMWDYHARFHADEGDTKDYLACVHYPCVVLGLQLFRHQPGK
jgi:uncharacterized SAM-dependent methyltransferase